MTKQAKDYKSKHYLDNKILKELLKKLDWEQYDLSRESGYNLRTINNWVTNKCRTPKIIIKYLELLLELDIKKKQLIEFIKDENGARKEIKD